MELGERATEMKKNAEKQQDSHQEPQRWTKVHKPHKDKDREKPRAKKGPSRPGSRPQRQAKDLGDKGSSWTQRAPHEDGGRGQLMDSESPQEDGERPTGAESTPQAWGVAHGDRRRPWTGEKDHRNWNKDAYYRDKEEGQEKWERVTEMEGGPQTPENPQRQNVDTKGPLRQEQPAHGEKGEAPRNRNSPHGGEGMGGEYGNSPSCRKKSWGPEWVGRRFTQA